MTELQAALYALQDTAYRDFQSRLLPTVDRERIIGVRTPQLRKFAAAFAKSPAAEAFLAELPHETYEENNLHGMLISRMKDADRCISELDAFLPYVDNWATCDLIAPGVLGRRPDKALAASERWMASSHPYTCRFGIGMLLKYYLDERFDPVFLERAAAVRSQEYYVNMMIAWFFAEALAKQYDAALAYIEQRRLDRWTHNKAIQKARESLRLTETQKAYLNTLKIH